MSTKSSSSWFFFIGWLIIIVGFLASIFIGANEESALLAIGGIVGSIISGIFFIGLGEIIDLLRLNKDNQEKIIELLDVSSNNSAKFKNQDEVLLQDIESNLPKI